MKKLFLLKHCYKKSSKSINNIAIYVYIQKIYIFYICMSKVYNNY